MPDNFEDRLKKLSEINTEPLPSEHGEETPFQAGLRHLLRTGKEIGSDVAGLPGDVLKSGLWGLNKAEQAGRWGIKQPERLVRWGLGQPNNESYTEKYLLPEQEEDLLSKGIKSFPGSEEIKSGINKTVGKVLPKNYLEATTEGEKLSDSFFGDAATLILPSQGIKGIGKALKTSGLMNLAAWGTKQLGGEEGAQTSAKLGSIVLEKLIGAPKVRNYAKGLYEIGDEEIRANPHHSVSLNSMEPLLKDLEHEANLGYFEKAGDKQKVLDIIDQVRNKAKERWIYNPEMNAYESSSSQATKSGLPAEKSVGTREPNWGKAKAESQGLPGIEQGGEIIYGENPIPTPSPEGPNWTIPNNNRPRINAGPNQVQEYTHMPEPQMGTEYTAQSTNKKPMDFIPENHLPVEEVWTFKKDMNEILGDTKTGKHLKPRVKRLVGGFKELLSEYGKENPRFWDAVSEADNIYGGLHQTSSINDFLQKHINTKTLGAMTAGMLIGHHHPLTIAKGITAGLSARYAVQGFEALKNSSAIRNYYGNVLAAAAKHDAKGVSKNIAALDRAIKKEYPEEKNNSEDNFNIDKFKKELRSM